MAFPAVRVRLILFRKARTGSVRALIILGLFELPLSQQIRRHLRQLGAFAFLQRNMPADPLIPKAFHETRQAVAGKIEVGMVDLLGIPHKHDFTAFSNPGYDRFHLMARQVLSLIHNNKLPGDGAPADIRQRLHLDAAEPHQYFLDIPRFFVSNRNSRLS